MWQRVAGVTVTADIARMDTANEAKLGEDKFLNACTNGANEKLVESSMGMTMRQVAMLR